MKQSMIYLIGVESSGTLSDAHLDRIRNCRALILSNRHRTLLASILGDQPTVHMVPIAPVQDALQQAARFLLEGDVVILATGDPLFFGIGRTLLDFFGPDCLVISPAISTMQLAFCRFKIPWDDAGFLSLHGRKPNNLAASILIYDKVFLFTDRESTPDRIASSLLAECGSTINSEYILHIAEDLGMKSERLLTGTLSEIAGRNFGPLTVMILVKTSPTSFLPSFGLGEDEIIHSRGLITKNEVRAATLHALRLPRQGVFWDVGAGSGSIGLEAARLFPRLQVLAVEREEEQIDNIQKNRQRFQTWNLQLFPGSAPDVLNGLPNPDRVFIGGSGGQLHAIIEQAATRLAPGGRIVINAVLEKTAQEAPKYLYEMGLQVTLSEIQVTRRSYPQTMDGPVSLAPGMDKERPQTMDGHVSEAERSPRIMHPITIIIGQKTNQDQESTHAD